jgi:hypothetical protein
MVLNHERSHNEQLKEQYIRWCIEKPIEFQSIVMKKLQDIGYLIKTDVIHIVLSYYAPIFLYFNQYMNHEYSERDKELFKESVMTATRNFLSVYKKNEEI